MSHDFDVDDFALASTERALLGALNSRGVRDLLIGRSTNRPKDLAALPALEATIRARADGGRED